MEYKIKLFIKKHNKVVMLAFVCALAAAVAIAAFFMASHNRSKEGELILNDPSSIEVTAEEMALYRERIGTDMDIKKAIIIMFETEEECAAFIDEHGNDKNPLEAGIGIVPLMEDGYYNIAGKTGMEEAFDQLSDGDCSPVPVRYSNLYCYLKRLGVDSVVNNDQELKELIQNEKYQELLRKAGE